MNNQQNILCNFLRKENILCGVRDLDGQAVLGKLIALLKQHSADLDIDLVRKEVENREALFPTMVAPGFAIPHARIAGLAEPLMAIACIPEGCDFGTENKAKVMVLLLTPVDNPNLHVQLMAALAADFVNPDVTEAVSLMGSPAQVYKHFSRTVTSRPDYLKAIDLMEPFPELLQETDSILDAVKKFSMTRTEELPVVDNTGDLRGILSLSDLLKYSLPEHLLWLEDLSPIYGLQPFSDMLKTADETKVADIMREDFIRAEINDPAVKLAKIFLISKLSQLIIVDGTGKPVGVVTLKNFSAKLFWD
ncbi:MAG: CBS domain-containing protein [Lentisphaeria bacterium]|nr:CBS domain-containing protein [Lentisphaeria bacterium]